MKYFSMFSGIGGFEYGIQKATNNQWECVGYSEIDKYAIQVYSKHFPTHTNYGNATKINPTELPDFDILVGGFPCQSFSIAGKRKGFEDTRGTLFFEIARILKAKKPSTCLLENVKGLVNHNGGKTFATILSTLSELGYDVEWQVLNSKHFGVPQNRERVFIIGHLGKRSSRKIFPFADSSTEIDTAQQQISSSIHAGYYKQGGRDQQYIVQMNNPTHSNDRIYSQDGISPSLNTMQGGNRQPKIIMMLKQTATKRTFQTPKEINEFLRENKKGFTNRVIAEKLKLPITQIEHYFRTDDSRAIPSPCVWKELKLILNLDEIYDKQVLEFYKKEIEFEQTRRVYDINHLSPTLNATQEPKIISHSPRSGNSKKGGTGENASSEHCFTLDSSPHYVNGIRRLTPTECARLQGFPDDWCSDLSDTQQYKCYGNAVTTNVIKKLIETVENYIN